MKQLIAGGRTVYAYVVTAALAPDGMIELIQIDIDITGPDNELNESDD